MLNYGNLNDVEFEYLCKDVMSRILDVKLQRYAPGRDGGIDLSDSSYKPKIIVQVKHYVKTDVAGLIRSLKSEIEKVEELHPESYYVCCSKELTPQKKSEIYCLFSEYMDSTDNVITLHEIDDFLSKPENSDILRKHFKLWIESTNVLTSVFTNDIFVDCDALLCNIHEEENLFVKTVAFEKAIDCLNKNNVIIMLGNPGVGKTITSKMLVLHYAANGYKIRYTTDGADLASLKRAISLSRETKEVILLDDCFGQAYFSMKETQENELLHLIKHIKGNPNKILIMNSRVTIYKEATERTPNLIRSLDNKEYKIFVLDMNNLSLVEKAKILYNHLYFNKIPKEFLNEIKKNKNYKKIIEHPNYSPRIIEYISSLRNINTIQAIEYISFIINSLKNPQEVWKNEYERRIAETDRVLLTTIYSLSNTMVSLELVKNCYNHRLSTMPGIDHSINQFEQSLARLSDAFIKVVDNRNTKMLSMANPSINDFIRAHLMNNPPEFEKIISSSISVQQLKRLLNDDEFDERLTALFANKNINHYQFESEEQKVAYITYYIASHHILDKSFQWCVDAYIRNITAVNLFENRFISEVGVLEKILQEEFCEFYGLTDFMSLLTLSGDIVDEFDLEDLATYIKAVDWIFKDDRRKEYTQYIKETVLNAAENYCNEASAVDFDIDVSEIIDDNTYIDETGSHIDGDEAVRDIEARVECQLRDAICDVIAELPSDILVDKSDIDKIYKWLDRPLRGGKENDTV